MPLDWQRRMLDGLIDLVQVRDVAAADDGSIENALVWSDMEIVPCVVYLSCNVSGRHYSELQDILTYHMSRGRLRIVDYVSNAKS
jgi:hypothetical protein